MAACSILKYFRSVGWSSSVTTLTFPDLDGPLSVKVPAKSIEFANAEVEESSHGHRLAFNEANGICETKSLQ